MGRLTKAAFKLAANTRMRKYLYHRYDYEYTPRQLSFLVQCLDRTANLPGAILEIGCAYGHTTVFLNEHLAAVGDQRRYICVDTFTGFTPTDVQYEQSARGKSAEWYRQLYVDGGRERFERTMAINGITSVTAITADVSAWDPDLPSGVSFCLIDVDLYRPVSAALTKVVPLVPPGGIVVVDDCMDQSWAFDGAREAYNQFTDAARLPRHIVEGNLGVIEIT